MAHRPPKHWPPRPLFVGEPKLGVEPTLSAGKWAGTQRAEVESPTHRQQGTCLLYLPRPGSLEVLKDDRANHGYREVDPLELLIASRHRETLRVLRG